MGDVTAQWSLLPAQVCAYLGPPGLLGTWDGAEGSSNWEQRSAQMSAAFSPPPRWPGRRLRHASREIVASVQRASANHQRRGESPCRGPGGRALSGGD